MYNVYDDACRVRASERLAYEIIVLRDRFPTVNRLRICVENVI